MGKILCDGFTCEPEFHADGEIWAQTLWDLRQRFVDDLGGNTLNGTGVTRVRNLITRGDGARAAGPELPGDAQRDHPGRQGGLRAAPKGSRIWAVFAERGMGYFATDTGSTDTASAAGLLAPAELQPRSPAATLTGIVREAEGGAPIANAVVEVKGPGDLVDTTNANGRYTIAARAAAHLPAVDRLGRRPPADDGRQRHRRHAATQTQELQHPPRLGRRRHRGATLIPASPPDFTLVRLRAVRRLRHLARLRLGEHGHQPGRPVERPGGAKSATVRLPQAVDVSAFAVDPGATCGDDDSASTQQAADADGDRRPAPSPPSGTFNYTPAKNHKLNKFVPGHRQRPTSAW